MEILGKMRQPEAQTFGWRTREGSPRKEETHREMAEKESLKIMLFMNTFIHSSCACMDLISIPETLRIKLIDHCQQWFICRADLNNTTKLLKIELPWEPQSTEAKLVGTYRSNLTMPIAY